MFVGSGMRWRETTQLKVYALNATKSAFFRVLYGWLGQRQVAEGEHEARKFINSVISLHHVAF